MNMTSNKMKRRMPPRRSRNSRATTVLLVVMVCSTLSVATAFAPPMRERSIRTVSTILPKTLDYPQSRNQPSISSSKTTTALNMVSLNWEEVVYHAQTVASNWASLSLSNDPSNLATTLPILYGAGLLTSFSPCVWGLLPLTMSYISNAAGERQDGKTTLPTLAYAAGLATVFCSLGVTAAQLGGVFGATTESAVLPILSNTICLAMGLKLLELVDWKLPQLEMGFLNPSSANGSGSTSSSGAPLLLIDAKGQVMPTTKQNTDSERGSLLRTFFLGGSAALVASPCATPVLTSILAFCAKAQNPWLGATLLLGYTLGYSTPLLLVASQGGQQLALLKQDTNHWYSGVGPWVTPLTGGILLWYGTNGMLVALFGDPSLAGLPVLQ